MKVTGIHEREGYVEVRVEGPFSPAHIEDLYAGAKEAAGRPGGERLLVNLLGVTGRRPNTTELYQLGLVASRLPKETRIAAAAPPGMMDPEKFGERVAKNRGANIEVFGDEARAVAWLTER